MNFDKKTVEDIDVNGLTVLVRVDYNVPLNNSGEITNNLRIKASLPTINYLLESGAKVVLISHLGRPEGQRNDKYSLEPVAAELARLLPDEDVVFVGDSIGQEVRGVIEENDARSITLLENLRFYPGEESNDSNFAKQLVDSTGADWFVQDGFAVVHRAHASTSAITKLLPSVAGFLLEHEVNSILSAVDNPTRPFLSIIGGAKISDKIGLIKKFIEKADHIIIGGAMANTFLQYKGFNVGKSLVEPGQESVISDIYKTLEEKVGAEKVDEFIILPKDVVVARDVDNSKNSRTKGVSEVSSDDVIFDIGPKTIDEIKSLVNSAKTVIWNGTLGMTEVSEFARASKQVAESIGQSREKTTIIGGGDTAGFVENLKEEDPSLRFSLVSTGGGASLELMSGDKLPGVESLLDIESM